MKQQLFALALACVTLAAIVGYPQLDEAFAAAPPALPATPPKAPPANGQRARVDLVFVLDTTGSMGGLIQTAKDKIWSIATSMARAQPAPEIRIGLVAYRDRGDQYVTQVFDLTTDLDSMYAHLMDFKADGGGDGPEAVNQALNDAIGRMSWSADSGAYKVVFLVGDAPPHLDYQDDVQFPATVALARQRGIVINTIQCGNDSSTMAPWQQIASLGAGEYLKVAQDGGAVAVTTPFDDKLARLSAELDSTRLYYGDASTRAEKDAKLAATRKLEAAASPAVKARRATYNASASGAANLAGDKELVSEVAEGRVDLNTINRYELPAPMQAMAPSEQKRYIDRFVDKRASLKKEVADVAAERDAWLHDKVGKSAAARDSLDAKLFGTLREQAKRVGKMDLDKAGPAY